MLIYLPATSRLIECLIRAERSMFISLELRERPWRVCILHVSLSLSLSGASGPTKSRTLSRFPTKATHVPQKICSTAQCSDCSISHCHREASTKATSSAIIYGHINRNDRGQPWMAGRWLTWRAQSQGHRSREGNLPQRPPTHSCTL